MVAPIIAAAGRVVGPMVRSAGGKRMHSSNALTRSSGGKMLGMNNDKALKFATERIAKHTNMALGVMKKISKGVTKIIGTLAKHSPALKQQLIVMGKAFSVILRPIGDIMAKFLRPMAIWVMKVAQKWYSLFGGGSDKGDPVDAMEQAQKQLDSAQAGGDPVAIAAAQKNFSEVQASVGDQGGKEKGPLGKLFQDLIPEALGEALKAIGGAFSSLWVLLEPLVGAIGKALLDPLKTLAIVLGGVLLGALWAITFVFKGLEVVFKAIALGAKTVGEYFVVLWEWMKVLGSWIGDVFSQAWENLTTNLKNIWAWIKDIFTPVWTALKDAAVKVYEWIKNIFIGVWDDVLSAMQSMWSGVKKIIDKLKFWKKKKDKEEEEEGSKAVGGQIDTTGMYKLHAGERVLTAGDASRAGNSSSNVFNTTVNLMATITNDLDIEELARKLADLNETELRRRVSYF